MWWIIGTVIFGAVFLGGLAWLIKTAPTDIELFGRPVDELEAEIAASSGKGKILPRTVEWMSGREIAGKGDD